MPIRLSSIENPCEITFQHTLSWSDLIPDVLFIILLSTVVVYEIIKRMRFVAISVEF